MDVRNQGVAVSLDISLSLDAEVYEEDWKVKGLINSININSIFAKNNTTTGSIDTAGL